MSDADDVEEANARFYRAFETLDIAEMDQVWVHAEHARCVHPGWALLCGWEAVRHSWQTIFTNTHERRRRETMQVADVVSPPLELRA